MKKQSKASKVLQSLSGCVGIIAAMLVFNNYGGKAIPLVIVIILCSIGIAIDSVLQG